LRVVAAVSDCRIGSRKRRLPAVFSIGTGRDSERARIRYLDSVAAWRRQDCTYGIPGEFVFVAAPFPSSKNQPKKERCLTR